MNVELCVEEHIWWHRTPRQICATNCPTTTAQGVKIPDPPVDFIRIIGKGVVEDYFLKETKPFYVKKVFGLFETDNY
ncbi:MAG: enhanced serine sensitivity protein SseB C-terminal domain-containing protein [Desulfosporosinus sp.]|nr:enhanced serine sensitivity protein SseB C-terminal domain-containing protein [Desulfosporosinus sp.]MDA8223029.1 hypothetical protein [Desulfitobacterium hafniense]